MNMRKITLSILSAAVLSAGLTSVTMAQTKQDIPALVYRTGAYAPGGIHLANGISDYLRLINSQGGINGVMINHPECDYGYKTDRGVECYDRLKTKYTAAMTPFSTGVTYAILEKATQDEIPIFTMGYGRTSAAKGNIFPWVFNFPATYWSQATSIVRYISYREGGMENLKGKRFAFIYLDHPYGKEPIPTFEAMSQKFGFSIDKYPVPAASMTEQKSIWLQIRRTRPDYAIMWGWGAMNSTAVKEAANIRFKMENFIGNWWAGAEPDVIPAGDGAIGYMATTFNGVGTDYPIYTQLQDLYEQGKGTAGSFDDTGNVLYSRGLLNAAYIVEAVKTAQAKYGNRAMTGAEVRWGFENLNITDARIKELGLTGLMPPVKVTCENHEGQNPGAYFQQWDGKKWNIKTDWVPAMTDFVKPLIDKDAAQYAAEKGIMPRDCN